jgi:hypothetical protein
MSSAKAYSYLDFFIVQENISQVEISTFWYSFRYSVRAKIAEVIAKQFNLKERNELQREWEGCQDNPRVKITKQN